MTFRNLLEKCLDEAIPEKIKQDALSGDCGMYAIALAKVLSEEGKDPFIGIAVNEEYDKLPSLKELETAELDIGHVVVVDEDTNKFYDAEGETTANEIYSEYFDGVGKMSILTYDPSEELETVIRRNTDYSHSWKFYYDVIKKEKKES